MKDNVVNLESVRVNLSSETRQIIESMIGIGNSVGGLEGVRTTLLSTTQICKMSIDQIAGALKRSNSRVYPLVKKALDEVKSGGVSTTI